ncbi:MAG: DUF3108 domain-containing protein [Hylemonella sp.]
MAHSPSEPAQGRRRWLLALALAVLLHLLVLGWLPLPQPASDAPQVLHPLIYSSPPAPEPATPQRPAPAPRPRPAAPAPTLPPVAAAAAASPPPAAPAEPPPAAAPTDAASAPAPQPLASAPAAAAPAASAPQVTAGAGVPPPDTPQPPLQVPSSIRLDYQLYGELSRLPYHASGELLWRHDGRRYEARMEIGAFLLGSRVQSSRGRLASGGLQPERFVDRVRKDRSVEFDPARGEIRFSEGAPTQPWADEVQDQLSAFIQLAALLGSAPQAYPPGTQLALTVVSVYGPQAWRFTVEGEEMLTLPGGTLRARKLSRAASAADEPRAELWLAPELGWLPARIRLSQDNGDFIDQQWKGSAAP